MPRITLQSVTVKRTAPAITGRAGIGAGGFGADPVPGSIKIEDRSAAGGNGVDMHHRCTHAHSGHHRFKASFVFAVVMGDIGGGAAHIKTNKFGKAGHGCRLDHADHPTGRAGKDGILSLKQLGIGQAAV